MDSLVRGLGFEYSRKIEDQEEEDKELFQEHTEREELTIDQETMMNNYARKIIENTIALEDLNYFREPIEMGIKRLCKDYNYDPRIISNLEKNIAILGMVSKIFKFGEFIIAENIIDPLLEFSEYVNTLEDFEGKGNLIATLINFFSDISYMNKLDESKSLYQRKNIGPVFFTFLNNILEINHESIQVLYALKALKIVLRQKILENEKNKANSVIIYFFFIFICKYN